MELITREHTDVKIVDFEGHLDTNTAKTADDYLKALIDSGATKLLLNFEKLDYISSAGLRVLLGTAKQLKTVDGELRLCQLNEEVMEVFDISGFSAIYKITATETDALNDF